MGMAALSAASCSDNTDTPVGPTYHKDSLAVFSQAEWLPGGEKGTTSNEQGCYSNPAPAVEMAGLDITFKNGENFFEHNANLFTRPVLGDLVQLGSVLVANSVTLLTVTESVKPSIAQTRWATATCS